MYAMVTVGIYYSTLAVKVWIIKYYIRGEYKKKSVIVRKKLANLINY